MRSRRPLGGDEAVDVLAVDLGSPRPGRARSASARARGPGRRAASSPATRPPIEWPTRWARVDALAVEELAHGADQHARSPSPTSLNEPPWPGQVERVDRAVAAQRPDVEQPVVEVAAEAVQQHDRLAALALAQEAQRAAADVTVSGCGAGVLLGLAGHEASPRTRPRTRRCRRRRPTRRRSRRAGRRPGSRRPRPPRGGAARPPTGDSTTPLIFSVSTSATSSPTVDLGALLDEPVDDPPLGHRQAPLGHAQLLDHARAAVAAPVVSRIAVGDRRPASARRRPRATGENGTGVCGGVTIRGARLEVAERLAARRARRCPTANPQRGFASSTTTSRPVFSTLSRIVSSSSGDVVRGSTISHVDAVGRRAPRRPARRAAPCGRARPRSRRSPRARCWPRRTGSRTASSGTSPSSV